MASGAGGPFDLVFLDPPYRQNRIAPALASLRDGGWLAPGAVIVAESAADEDALATPAGFTNVGERIYGETRVTFLRSEVSGT